jgi:N-acetylglucosamine-6-phosphate deacetylase
MVDRARRLTRAGLVGILLTMARRMLLSGARICLPEATVEGAFLAIEDGRIVAIGKAPSGFAGDRVDLPGATICPGFIDTHVHGGLEHDVMDATPEAMAAICAHLARHGVTSWLPTTLACPAAHLDRTLAAVASAMASPPAGARILGAHLESNFLAPKFKGAQPAEALRPPDDPELLAILERHQAIIRVVTLAPELPGALELIKLLRGWGILVAVGHSDATYDQVVAAAQAGATRVTHLCNAQRPFHHREPGVVGAALVIDALSVEIIADLVHVHPAGVQMAYRCKGVERLMLVSDALRGAGLPPGQYELGGRATTLDGHVARLADGTIAGSVITLEQAIKNVTSDCGIPFVDAVRMASTAPAASLGLLDRGAIAPGMRADLAILEANGNCLATVVEGEWVHGPFCTSPQS